MDDKEKLVQMLLRCSLATGHADTMDDLIAETESQIMELRQHFAELVDAVKWIITEDERSDPFRMACAIDHAKEVITKATGGE